MVLYAIYVMLCERDTSEGNKRCECLRRMCFARISSRNLYEESLRGLLRECLRRLSFIFYLLSFIFYPLSFILYLLSLALQALSFIVNEVNLYRLLRKHYPYSVASRLLSLAPQALSLLSRFATIIACSASIIIPTSPKSAFLTQPQPPRLSHSCSNCLLHFQSGL
jgi:hypothetical protein